MEYGEKIFYLIGNDKADAVRNSAVYESRRAARIVSEGKKVFEITFAVMENDLREV